jgi:hypothetical protein
MTFDEFVFEVLRAERAELEKRLRGLRDGESLCVHERHYGERDWLTRNMHVLYQGQSCNGSGRRSQYGPMTPEIRAAAEALPSGG